MKRLKFLAILLFLPFSLFAQENEWLGDWVTGTGGSPSITETTTNITVTKDTITLEGHVVVTTIEFVNFSSASAVFANAAGDSIAINPNGFAANNSNAAGIYVFQYGSAGGDTARIDSNAVGYFPSIKLGPDVNNFANFTVAADGALTITTVDAAAAEADINFAPDGNVGIKTVAPSVAFEVTGAITASQIVSGSAFKIGGTNMNLTSSSLNFDTMISIHTTGSGDNILIDANTGGAANVDIGAPGDGDGLTIHGNINIGAATAIDTQDPSLIITTDADNDGTAFTTDAFTINYAAVSDPTAGLWTATTTQSAGFDFDMPLIASTLTSDVSLSVGAGSPSSAFHLKANLPGTVGTDPAGQIIIQTPSNDITANVVITGYDSDGAGDPEDQLWYLGSSAASNSDITFVNRQNASLTLGTNDLYRFFLENDGDVQLRKTNATAIVDGTSIAEIQFFGDDDTASADEIAGQIETIATSTWTNGNEDAKMVLNVANNGVLNISQLVLNTDGSVQFGFAPIFASYTRHRDIEAGGATVGSTAPTPTTIGTARGLGFDADAEVVHFESEIPSDWDGISNFTILVHWYSTSGDAVANGETVKWDITYRSIAVGEAVDNGTVVVGTVTFTGGASETDKELYESSITIVYTGGNQPLTVGDRLLIQFDRDKSGDTYSGMGIVMDWDVTHTANTLPEH